MTAEAPSSAGAEFECVEPDDEVYGQLSSRFGDFNAAHSTWDWRSFSIIRRERDALVAGGRGILNMGAVEIRGLWVDEARRGSGFGARLLAAIEAEAVRRGARKALLDTYCWQAEPFYLRHGYRRFATFDYPDGFKRLYLEKDL